VSSLWRTLLMENTSAASASSAEGVPGESRDERLLRAPLVKTLLSETWEASLIDVLCIICRAHAEGEEEQVVRETSGGELRAVGRQ
jgi:hypothetical protein